MILILKHYSKHFHRLILVTLLLALSCNTQEKKGHNSLETEQLDFLTKLENKPKIFLDYWEGMTNDEFRKVTALLIEKNILTGKYPLQKYNLGYCENIWLQGNFDKSLELIEIQLAVPDCFYDFYKEKYNLPDRIERQYHLNWLESPEMVSEKVLPIASVPLIIDKGINVISLDYQSLRDWRIRTPLQKDYPSFADSFGKLIIYYNTKSLHLARQSKKREIRKNHQEKVLRERNEQDNRIKNAKNEI